MNADKSIEPAMQYYRNLGYLVVPVLRGKGYDFTIERDGKIQTVEAKTEFLNLHPKELEVLEKGGLLAIIHKNGTVSEKTIKDLISKKPTTYYICKFK